MTMREKVKYPGVGTVSSSLDGQTSTMLKAMAQILETMMGIRGPDHLDTALTHRDLVNYGLITESQVPKK